MKTTIREERLIILSDLHLGNPLMQSGRRFRDLLQYAMDNRYSVCINGDGVDIVQMSIGRLTHELSQCFNVLSQFSTVGLRVYYTVGNHDIVFEHFLRDWSGLTVVPFLNVLSGDKRIRVEHGHMYDSIFLRFPRFYSIATILGGWTIRVSPTLYHVINRSWLRLISSPDAYRSWRSGNGVAHTPSEHPSFRAAAEEIAQRGFDAVVFGHTHYAGHAPLRDGAQYFNTGFWLSRPFCVVLEDGNIWFGPVDELAKR